MTNIAVCNNIPIDFDSHTLKKDRAIFKSFALQPIKQVYEEFKQGKEIYFFDYRNKPVKVLSITKEPYSGKIYDVDVKNDIVLVRRKNSSAIWSGNSNNGTFYGDATINLSGGRYEGGAQFDGNGDYVQVPNSVSLNITGNITISVWINLKTFPTHSQIISKGERDDAYGLIVLDTAVTMFVVEGPGSVNANTTLSANTWYHIVGTYKKRWRLFKDLDKNEKVMTLVVSEKHRVYANQINPLRNSLIKSDVVNTLTSDCCLRCGSFDQIDALIDNAAARYGESSGSDKTSLALLRNALYFDSSINSISDSTSFCLISNSCSESLDLNKHSSLCSSNSDLIKSGAENVALIEENKYELMECGFISEKSTLLSGINIILVYNPNFFLSSGEICESNFLNLPFLAFLPSSTDHLINSCSSLEFSFFNSKAPIFCLLINSSLARLDQFTQVNLDISDFSSGSNANVTDAIHITPLAFNSSNLLSSLTLRDITLRTTSATLISGNSSLKLFNTSSGTDTVILGILFTSNNYVNTSKYVDVYKSFDLEGNDLEISGFELMPITDVYSDVNDGKKVYFLDALNRPVRVLGIEKQPYSGKIYDVENDIVLVRRKNNSAIWSWDSKTKGGNINGDWNDVEKRIIMTVPSANKFAITNSSGTNMTSINNQGNMYLKLKGSLGENYANP